MPNKRLLKIQYKNVSIKLNFINKDKFSCSDNDPPRLSSPSNDRRDDVLDVDDVVVVGNDIVDGYESYDSKEKQRKALVV